MKMFKSSVVVLKGIVTGLLFTMPLTYLYAAENTAHFQLHGKVIPLAEDGIHDPEDDAVAMLQVPGNALADFPRDKHGLIDWIGVVDNGVINPRADVQGQEKITPVDFDVIMKNTASMPYVLFPHMPHTKWLTCQNCHPGIFLPQKGGNFISMAAVMQGDYCGVCHGKVSFPPLECARCHSVPKESAGFR